MEVGGLANRARRGAEEVELSSKEGARGQPGTEVAVVEASSCIALRKKEPPCRGQLTMQGRRSEQAAQEEPAAHQAVLAAALKRGLAWRCRGRAWWRGHASHSPSHSPIFYVYQALTA